MLIRCLECFASNAYSCFSKAALTSLAVIKVIVSISIIVIVAVKLEDVRVELQVPGGDLASFTANLTATLLAGAGSSSSAPATTGSPNLPSPPSPAPSSSAAGGNSDVDMMAGPFHVNASCLLQHRGLDGQLSRYTRTMCSYVYAVCSISLMATFVMGCLLWCTCHLCGWGPMLELVFALLGTAWWLAAALVLQENTAVAVNAKPAALQLILSGGFASSPPPLPPGSESSAAALLSPPPPPPAPPHAPVGHDVVSQVAAQLQELTPKNLAQWRGALVGLSWAMMAMWAVCSGLLLVEACGCLLDCCSCLVRCCCPDRPESRWRTNLRNRRKRLGSGEEYVEMRGGMAPSASMSSGGGCSSGGYGGPPPAVMVVARSDDGSVASSPAARKGKGLW